MQSISHSTPIPLLADNPEQPWLYTLTVPLFLHQLSNCKDLLAKGLLFCQSQGLPETEFLQQRLAPDMLPLAAQVHMISDGARGGAARLVGHSIEPAEDARFAVFNRGAEADFPQNEEFLALVERIDQTLAYLQSLSPGNFAGPLDRPIEVQRCGQSRHFTALPFVLSYLLPNFHFHFSIAYGILRYLGVPLGKKDFEGEPVYRLSGTFTGASS